MTLGHWQTSLCLSPLLNPPQLRTTLFDHRRPPRRGRLHLLKSCQSRFYTAVWRSAVRSRCFFSRTDDAFGAIRSRKSPILGCLAPRTVAGIGMRQNSVGEVVRKGERSGRDEKRFSSLTVGLR